MRVDGYHRKSETSIGNEKYLAIQDHAFHVGIERACGNDYITEKVTDAIMCGSVPVCQTAPNLADYFIENSYVRTSDVATIDWANWESEFEKRKSYVRAQREVLRTRLNVFSYFHVLTEDLSQLIYLRPIVLDRSHTAEVF